MCVASLLLSMCIGVTSGDLVTVARKVADQINDSPSGFASLYGTPLLKIVPVKKFINLYKGFHEQHGRVTSVTLISQDSDVSGKFRFAYEKGVTMKVTLTLSKKKPSRLIGILFSPPSEGYKSIKAVVKDLRTLPGQVSFQLARLGEKVEVLHSIHPETALAIGSTFKLYILGTLAVDGKSWSQVTTLNDKNKSLPSGVMHKWPDGAPVTLHTLASAMISVSDNTATDHLIAELGRDRVESYMGRLGHAHPERAWPLLKTREMFVLKSDPDLLADYIEGDLSTRRKLLTGKVARFARDDLAPYPDGTPIAIDTVEWFASASDLCRMMDWFRRSEDNTALDILAINPGIDISKDQFPYVGYKGGSEPGVLNMTWLLRAKSGTYYALSIGWNNPGSDGTDLMRLIGLAQPMIDLLGKS